MEFAQAARQLGLRAIHGAELTVLDGPGMPIEDARHLTLLVRDARGWANLCRLLTRALAHTREADARRSLGAPSVTLADVEEHAEGLVCLSGCARRGVRDEPTMRRLLAAFGRDALPGRAAAAVRPPRPRAEPRPRRARRAPRRAAAWRPATSTRTRRRARALQDALRRRARAHDARRLRAAAPRQPRARPGHARGDGRALRRPPRGGRRDRAARRDADVRPHARPRLPLPRGRGRRRRSRRSPRSAAPASRTATRRAPRCATRPPRAWTRSSR